MKIVVNDVSYYVEIYGKGEPLLLLHGFTGSVETWKSFIPKWQDDKQLIMVDIIGHGLTDSPDEHERYKIERAAADLAGILQYFNIEKTNVLGYSMGGRLALTFAILYPHRVNKLILESSSPGLKSDEERRARIKSDEALALEIETYGIKHFVEKWENIPLFSTQKRLPQIVQERIRTERLRNNAKGLANSLRGMGTGKQPSWWNRLSELKMPTLLICGELDEKFCRIASEMARFMPNAVVSQISDSGHAIHVEQPEIFAKIVDEFI
ncbi:2-succinyl-6-hydroxy-2,4-cyclohexadiene-1-carboxylate synthase [Anoxybacillus vitaminiphilus]|uniref:Putative 2-succinyl-6-hydroxy-2,4-cyclohexadiene-1-carboxylate synthase n=1 Tax=Paranoxybacillus vitaminiphilus TaxID=581036 RepID=A0A327YJA1_9BACL|nr:2-succinyl-6-hydroxy-2,4-cyclohexadiene-1-carboxylate synthase [Anoxybacillus vitaminiphilus]RAK21074.1 2-succinyl-6-hydroxy-2,4-cyclohexadiene-1-carboxylate synthase [Anoxybacillus vitaminiphilus]